MITIGKRKHVCINCNSEFEDYSDNTKFCSRMCYEQFRQSGRVTKVITCPVCKNKFLQARRNQVFCSNSCKHKSTESRSRCVCEHCGRQFERKNSEVSKNKRHYCSDECKMNSMFWSNADTDILIENYKRLSYRQMSDGNIFSVYRTPDEIRRRAIYIGITSSREWSDDEIDTLKNNYSEVSMSDLMLMLPQRTKSSILRKAFSYGLKSKFYLTHMYSEKEDEYIKNNYLLKTNDEMGNELNRSAQGIAEHLRILDLHRPTEIDNYKTLSDYIRSRITPWRDSVRRSNNYTCALTGKRSNIVVHHIRSFNLLFYETIERLNFPIYDDFSSYKQGQLDAFLKEFIDTQEHYDSYICISENIHKRFHSEYGYGNNTECQWAEFVNKYYSKEIT